MFTGNPTAPTPTAGDNDTSVATTAFVTTANGLLVPKSLVDAKGDLLVGSANDTVARLPAGIDGYMLEARASEATGLKWIPAPSGGGAVPNAWPRKSTQYYTTTHPLNGTNIDANSFGTSGQRLWLLPFEVTHPQSLDRLGINIATAGAASSLMWLGLYDHSDAFGTINRIAHGSVAADSTGDKAATIASGTLAVGMYWLAVGHNGTSNSLIVRRASAFGGRQGALGGGIQFSTEWAPRYDAINFATVPGLPATLNLGSASSWDVNDVPLVWARKT